MSKKRGLDYDDDVREPKNQSCFKKRKIAESTFFKEWEKHELLAEIEKIDLNVSTNLVNLFDDDNTIPFIARYRKEMTGGLTAEKLRHIKSSYDMIDELKVKAEKVSKTIASTPNIDPSLIHRVKCAKSMEELEFLAAPLKKENKGTLAARAKKLGLEKHALNLLLGSEKVHFSVLIRGDESLNSENKIATGIQHIVADLISKDPAVLSFLEDLKKKYESQIILECAEKTAPKIDTDKQKYRNYFEFRQCLTRVKDYQVLAINRAEKEKVLSVKITFPAPFWEKLRTFSTEKWLSKGIMYDQRRAIFNASFNDAVSRLLCPMITRQIRNNLTTSAERSSIAVFGENLKSLLLIKPLKGRVVLGIDPGIKHGCKLALISPHGELLYFTNLFLYDQSQFEKNSNKLKEILLKHWCETIALGNGKYCRETEKFLSDLIAKGFFNPLDVQYSIVSEQGVSIYSCSKTAAEEFPDISDPLVIGAASIARRLQDPLSELIKVDPKHLGVGMYQHDVSEKKLTTTLDDVVSECVSFVGVDANTGSCHLIKRVAGMTKARAEALIAYRRKNGPFTNRNQLKKVKGIGEKTFKQCVGFIRINPTTALLKGGNKQLENPLDSTEIHPEHYELTNRLLKTLLVDPSDLGEKSFVEKVNQVLKEKSTETLAKILSANLLTVGQILEAICQEREHDLRCSSNEPIFCKSFTSFELLKADDILTGVVTNIVPFGAFVDVGVGRNGLIYSVDFSVNLKIGARVKVRVLSVDVPRKRISLSLMCLL